MKWNGVQMKSKTYDTWNRQVVWDKSGRQIVLCEVISCKVEISWLHENQALKWLWRKLSDCKTGLRNFVVTLNIQVSNSLQWMAKIWDKWKLKGDIILNLLQWLKKPYEAVLVERKNRNILNVALNIVSEATTWKYCEIMFSD